MEVIPHQHADGEEVPLEAPPAPGDVIPAVALSEDCSIEDEALVEPAEVLVSPTHDPSCVGLRGGVGKNTVPRNGPTLVSGRYNTRSTGRACSVETGYGAAVIRAFTVHTNNEVEEPAVPVAPERPPKPKVPTNRVCAQDARWRAADARETEKLNAENTFIPLPRDEQGRVVRPDNAIVLPLLRVREYKWKKDPDSGVEIWLECCRFVLDGSRDKRQDKFYAETPDRMLLMMMIGIGASTGEGSSTSDVERAYLNALSIDRNIVVIAPPDMAGLPREALLNKGLYGSRAGALSWEVFIDGIMKALEYNKLQVARGVYIKKLDSGEWLRAYRHSDDFRLSSSDEAGRIAEEVKLRAAVRMAEFAPVRRFLGCVFEYINAETAEPDLAGTIVLVRQKDKILEMKEKFLYLSVQYNPGRRECAERRRCADTGAGCIIDRERESGVSECCW